MLPAANLGFSRSSQALRASYSARWLLRDGTQRIARLAGKLRRIKGDLACVTHPVRLDEAGALLEQEASGPPLRWRKRRCGPVVFVWSGWSLARRAIGVLPCADGAARFAKARAPQPYTRTVPRIIDAPPELAREQAIHLAAGPVAAPEGGLGLFLHATVAASGVLMTADAQVVGESLNNTGDWSAFGAFRRCGRTDELAVRQPPLTLQRRLGPAPHVMLKQTFDANYGHWLVEGLPRLAAAAEHVDLTTCRFIVSAGHAPMQRVYRDSLAICGIAPAQVVEVGYAPVHVDRLIYPLPVTRHPWIKSPTVVPFLEAIADRVGRPADAPRRIFVTRSCGRRTLLNEAAIAAVARSYGFTVVSPATMSFVEQVRWFGSAEIVVGGYGANLTNVAFAPRGAALFALTTPDMQDDFFWDLMDHKHGAYVSLHGERLPGRGGPNADYTIDAAQFTRTLRSLL